MAKMKRRKGTRRRQYALGKARINREFKSSVFAKLFSDRKALLSLYNALNKSHYTDERQLEINTIDDVVYMGIKNDVSFIVGSYVNLYEHQSTFCPNMPLRTLLYFARLYESYIETHEMKLYSTTRLTLPTPRAVVFYNGTREYADEMELKLSDSFQNGDGCIELTVTMLNINFGHNQELLESCRVLGEYSCFIEKIREYERQGMPRAEAVDEACKYCIEHDILQDFLLKNRSEVVEVLLTKVGIDEYLECEKTDIVRENLLMMLESHLGTIPAARRAEIEQEDNLDVLNRWFKEECVAAEQERDAAESRADVAEHGRTLAESRANAAEQELAAAEAENARLRAALAAKENG